jgi:hypothetical protein
MVLVLSFSGGFIVPFALLAYTDSIDVSCCARIVHVFAVLKACGS